MDEDMSTSNIFTVWCFFIGNIQLVIYSVWAVFALCAYFQAKLYPRLCLFFFFFNHDVKPLGPLFSLTQHSTPIQDQFLTSAKTCGNLGLVLIKPPYMSLSLNINENHVIGEMYCTQKYLFRKTVSLIYSVLKCTSVFMCHRTYVNVLCVLPKMSHRQHSGHQSGTQIHSRMTGFQSHFLKWIPFTSAFQKGVYKAVI